MRGRLTGMEAAGAFGKGDVMDGDIVTELRYLSTSEDTASTDS